MASLAVPTPFNLGPLEGFKGVTIYAPSDPSVPLTMADAKGLLANDRVSGGTVPDEVTGQAITKATGHKKPDGPDFA